MATEPIDVRMARLEGAYQQIDRRLAAMQADIRDLRGRMDEGLHDLRGRMDEGLHDLRGRVDGGLHDLRGRMDEGFSSLRREMRQQFYWLLGILVIGILVPLYLRLYGP